MAEIDLNLLRVFDALMELRSVTRVADRLGLTQSAVSHALGRLRRMLDDPLFMRGPRGLQPSARAEQIAPNISASLQQLREALAPPHFTPASALRTFTIAAGGYFCRLILPPLLERLRHEAPTISLQVTPLIEGGMAMLDRGAIDFALGGLQNLPSRFVVERLFHDDMVWIAAKTHRLAQQPCDLSAILSTPRVRIAPHRPFLTLETPEDENTGAIDPFLQRNRDGEAEAPAVVYDSQTAAAIVARTDMVACIPRRIAEREKRGEDIVVLMAACPPQTINLAMVWHNRRRSDLGHMWLRSLISEVTNHSE
ncbi:LysR family transcriptional regulator [Novosphingobium rosa]|uniref:LysR family transcriptional regulator n=1 Tax=Novosphingobium rosa TaxID=76978 RepID=UPI0008363656|nr:LysR family transcriptional regulator [Novosphingobium rosa]